MAEMSRVILLQSTSNYHTITRIQGRENVNSKQREYQQRRSIDGDGGRSLDDDHSEYGGSS